MDHRRLVVAAAAVGFGTIRNVRHRPKEASRRQAMQDSPISSDYDYDCENVAKLVLRLSILADVRGETSSLRCLRLHPFHQTNLDSP